MVTNNNFYNYKKDDIISTAITSLGRNLKLDNIVCLCLSLVHRTY